MKHNSLNRSSLMIVYVSSDENRFMALARNGSWNDEGWNNL